MAIFFFSNFSAIDLPFCNCSTASTIFFYQFIKNTCICTYIQKCPPQDMFFAEIFYFLHFWRTHLVFFCGHILRWTFPFAFFADIFYNIAADISFGVSGDIILWWTFLFAFFYGHILWQTVLYLTDKIGLRRPTSSDTMTRTWNILLVQRVFGASSVNS